MANGDARPTKALDVGRQIGFVLRSPLIHHFSHNPFHHRDLAASWPSGNWLCFARLPIREFDALRPTARLVEPALPTGVRSTPICRWLQSEKTPGPPGRKLALFDACDKSRVQPNRPAISARKRGSKPASATFVVGILFCIFLPASAPGRSQMKSPHLAHVIARSAATKQSQPWELTVLSADHDRPLRIYHLLLPVQNSLFTCMRKIYSCIAILQSSPPGVKRNSGHAGTFSPLRATAGIQLSLLAEPTYGNLPDAGHRPVLAPPCPPVTRFRSNRCLPGIPRLSLLPLVPYSLCFRGFSSAGGASGSWAIASTLAQSIIRSVMGQPFTQP
jgi:hypothetical protein